VAKGFPGFSPKKRNKKLNAKARKKQELHYRQAKAWRNNEYQKQ
jgi:hypothetical protein